MKLGAANPNYKRTFEVLDLEHPPILVHESDTHYQYQCPNCISKRGKPDWDGKLYFSKIRNSGLCFKCNTVFFPPADDTSTPEGQELSQNLGIALSRLTKFDNEYVDPPRVPFEFDDLSIEHLSYLRTRHPFLPSLTKILGARAWNGSMLGVAFPFIYKDYVAKYQVRFDTTDKKRRYYTSPGPKVPYSPAHIFSNFELHGDSTITLVEGTFDAIAAWILGYPNPIGILGASLTNFQKMMIRKLMPDNAFIMMDDKFISEAIQSDIRKNLPSISDTQVISLGDDVDPEDYLKEEIKDPEKLREYAENTAKLVRQYS